MPKWHDVPNFALIDPKTNKLGYSAVWLFPHGRLKIYCFLPGQGAERRDKKPPCHLPAHHNKEAPISERSPVEICLGTSPSQAAKSRPLPNASPLPMAA